MYSIVSRGIGVVFVCIATIAIATGYVDLALRMMLCCAVYLLVLVVGEERSQ